jgi:hypothetical protein
MFKQSSIIAIIALTTTALASPRSSDSARYEAARSPEPEAVCEMDRESRRACTTEDITTAVEDGLLMSGDARTAPILVRSEGLGGHGTIFWQIDDGSLLFHNDGVPDDRTKYPPKEGDSSTETLLACIGNAEDSYAECRQGANGEDAIWQLEICADMYSEALVRCVEVYG